VSAPWPNFFVVGAARAGTTSLYHYLAGHPDIYMSPLKEPHFFSRARPEVVPFVKDEREYLRLFEPGAEAKIRGEASPTYLADPETPAKIKRVSPDARVVIVLREPVSRAHSAYWHLVRYGVEPRSFLEAVQDELRQDEFERYDPTKLIVAAGLYADAVGRYFGTFGTAALVLFFDDLARDARGEVAKVLAHLGLDTEYAQRFRLEVRNRFALPRNRLARRLYGSQGARNVGRSIVPDAFHTLVERLLLRGNGLPEMEPEARRLLADFYRSDTERLEAALGRSVPWGEPLAA
jgi:hypothetical protein